MIFRIKLVNQRLCNGLVFAFISSFDYRLYYQKGEGNQNPLSPLKKGSKPCQNC